MSHGQHRAGVVRAVLRGTILFVVLGIVCPGSAVAAERPSRKAPRERTYRPRTDKPPVPVDDPPLRMRVETPEGVLVVYDAASPPGGEEGCSGYLAYWRSTLDHSKYVFPEVLEKEDDLTKALLALQRNLGVDLELLADGDERVGRALGASAETAEGDLEPKKTLQRERTSIPYPSPPLGERAG